MAVPMQTLKVTAGNMTAALYYYWRGTPGGKWELYVDSVSVEKASSSATFTSVTVGINWSGASSGELEWTRRATGTTGVKASAASIARGTARKTVTLNLEEYVYNGGASVMNSTSVTLTVPYLPIVSSIATARTSDAAGNVPDPMGKYLKVTVGWSKDPLVTTGSTIAVSSAPDGSGGSATSAGGSGTSATTTLVVGGASSGRRADAAYTVTATATDGEHGAKSLSVTDKTAYTKPVITSVESVRTDPGGDLADEGTCAKVTVGWRVACLGSQTTPTSLSVTLGGASQVKTSSWGGTYGDSRLSGTSEFLFPDVNLDVNSAYGVQVALADSLNSQTKGDTITTAFFTMDVLGDAYWDEEAQEGERPGHGVAWGGACSSEGFWNHMKSFFLNLLRIVKPSSSAPAHALEVSDGDVDTATLDWSGNAWFAGAVTPEKGIYAKSGNLTSNVAVSSATGGDSPVRLTDSAGALLGCLRAHFDASSQGVQLYANRMVGGTTKYNILRLAVDGSGNPVVDLTAAAAAAWRTALGLGTWATLAAAAWFTVGSGWTVAASSVSYNAALGVVKVYLQLRTTAARSAANVTLGTVASAYRPSFTAGIASITAASSACYINASGSLVANISALSANGSVYYAGEYHLGK